MYHLALVPARNMQVTRFRDSVAISYQNRDKFEPLLLACLTRETYQNLIRIIVINSEQSLAGAQRLQRLQFKAP